MFTCNHLEKAINTSQTARSYLHTDDVPKSTTMKMDMGTTCT